MMTSILSPWQDIETDCHVFLTEINVYVITVSQRLQRRMWCQAAANSGPQRQSPARLPCVRK
jgi:hypothetical protein